MKTRNAFAFRDFDATRILQRPYFKNFREEYHIADKTDEEILESLNAADDDSVDDMERKLHAIEIVHEKLIDFNHFIGRHQKRLNQRKYRDEKIDDIVLGYFYAAIDCVELTKKISALYNAVEKRIQQQQRIEFAARLKQARRTAGYTQRQLADMVQISPTGFAQYEQGRNDPSLLTLSRISKILKISSDKLLGITR